MKQNIPFKNSNSNKFYQSVKTKTTEIGFKPNYLTNEKDRTKYYFEYKIYGISYKLIYYHH